VTNEKENEMNARYVATRSIRIVDGYVHDRKESDNLDELISWLNEKPWGMKYTGSIIDTCEKVQVGTSGMTVDDQKPILGYKTVYTL